MKKLFFLFIIAFISVVSLQAQPLNRSTPEASQKAAEKAEAEGNYFGALEKFEDVYSDTKDKAVAVKVAMLNYQLRDYNNAERGFSRLVLRDRKKEFVELQYWYAMSLKANGKYQESIDMFNQYLATGTDSLLLLSSKREIAGAELGRKAKQPDNLKVDNAGKKVNSPQTESTPVYSGGQLYFSTLAAKQVITLDGKEGDWYAKIYTSQKNGAEFGDPTPLGTQINREDFHQGNVSISNDGNTMYFTRNLLTSNVVTESKIYYATLGTDGWGAANEVQGVNGDYLAKHPCEGELFGEKVLFFTAVMPGGKGGYDLYYAPKRGPGQFGLPVNLGAVVNTSGDEVSPFYRDGKLYFSSNGHLTFGGLDVYETQWNGTVWSAPKQMPLGINSSLDDQYYTTSADGYSGFLVSNRPGPNNLKSKTCCDDIYMWELERIKVDLTAKTFRPKRKADKEQPILEGATVQLIDVTDKNPNNIDQKTLPTGNAFQFTLQPEKSYLVIASKEGYKSDTAKVNTVNVKKSASMERKLLLRPLKKEPDSIVVKIDEPIRLNRIYYDFDDDKILAQSEPDLQFLVDLMTKYPDMKIELSSHTDSRGKDEYNIDLSQRRANSAKKWIVAKGIVADRIVAKGYGETQLLNQCANGVECTEDEHRLNRRTEFKIIAGPTSITIERKEKKD